MAKFFNSKLDMNCSPALIQYHIKENKINQSKIAKYLDLSRNAVSLAVNNDPAMQSLRKKIIELLKDIKTINKIQKIN